MDYERGKIFNLKLVGQVLLGIDEKGKVSLEWEGRRRGQKGHVWEWKLILVSFGSWFGLEG